MTTISSREFNQDISKAKRDAKRGAVIITDRGKPSHVLLSFEEYEQITGSSNNIIELLGMPSSSNIEFEPETLKSELFKPADLS